MKRRTSAYAWDRVAYSCAASFGVETAEHKSCFDREYEAQYQRVPETVEIPTTKQAWFWYRVGIRRFRKNMPL